MDETTARDRADVRRALDVLSLAAPLTVEVREALETVSRALAAAPDVTECPTPMHHPLTICPICHPGQPAVDYDQPTLTEREQASQDRAELAEEVRALVEEAQNAVWNGQGDAEAALDEATGRIVNVVLAALDQPAPDVTVVEPEGMDLEAQGELSDQLDAAQAAVERVRAVHVPSLKGRWCATCRGPYPCSTVRALDGDTTEES